MCFLSIGLVIFSLAIIIERSREAFLPSSIPARRGGERARGHPRLGNPVASQGLEGDLLCLVDAGALDRPEPVHELSLQRAVVGLGPRAVLLQGLGHAHLEVEASSTHLSRDLGVGELLEPGEELVEEDWHALRDSESPGPPDGPGEYLHRHSLATFSNDTPAPSRRALPTVRESTRKRDDGSFSSTFLFGLPARVDCRVDVGGERTALVGRQPEGRVGRERRRRTDGKGTREGGSVGETETRPTERSGRDPSDASPDRAAIVFGPAASRAAAPPNPAAARPTNSAHRCAARRKRREEEGG
eukprot:CAMPEP_0172572728 /NCGR_PEP_ID=MMETSP1067-20121228/135826_1 /TAXON_ID=265564 ORGANISM="Thalassiosira punctigera, Strain Tpunct2005C2" /NCGR_SAMPLE_ID=MMETSP1067 /ASSEMBLY_ACC=CAM_ASM_000444 /LENGTH=300 /DNA_ID=CAMNT_0013365311 /DNA_START=128 /DNA_END=1027 /DNA_ORIENTATION=+